MNWNKTQNILAITFASILFIIFIYQQHYNETTFTDIYKQIMLKKEIEGIVLKIEEDKRNRGAITYTFDNGAKMHALPMEWDNLIDIGDSIVKQKNELLITLKKSNGIQHKLDYNDYLNKMDELGYFSKSISD